MGRPGPTGDRKTFIYYPGQVALPNEAAPRILCFRDGKPTFVYNCLVPDHFTFAGKEPLPKGKV
jgi:arylsulfatase